MKQLVCAALLLVIPAIADAAPGDYISLRAGGIMTRGLEVSIDLDTGIAKKRSLPRGSVAPGEQPTWQESTKKLTSEELKSLTDAIRSGLNEGFVSTACIEKYEAASRSGKPPLVRPPPMDSITFMNIRLDGRDSGSPDTECRTPAFNRVWGAAYNAASP